MKKKRGEQTLEIFFAKQKRGAIRLVLLFLIIATLLILPGLFLFIKETTPTKEITEEAILPFKVDQLLIKTLVKEGESTIRPIDIMDVSDEDLVIEIEPQYLLDIVTISDPSFTLKPGQTKTVDINIRSFIEEKNIKQELGIYVGSLLIKGKDKTKRIPVIIEIETKEVLFDANIETPIGQKQIKQGDYLEIQTKLFNLKKIGLTSINMDYFIKDIFGNTIITESESITVETQISFVKTIHIPENLNPGEYVFGVIARYGSSAGTSSFLFEVASPVVEKKDLFDYYKDYKLLFWILGIILLIIIAIGGPHIYFLIRLHIIHDGVIHLFKEKLQKIKKSEKEEKKLIEKEIPKKIIEEGISKKEMLIHLCLRLLENFRRLTKKEKTFILIMILVVSSIILISVLIDVGILSSEQLSMGNIFVKVKSAFSISLDWIIKYYLHMIIVALLIATIVSAYLKRDIIVEHKKLFWLVLIIIIFILISLLILLLYSRITAFAQLSQL